jgi:Rps23 Pro-64 3,4-dihydroxylase Tpa1-like proline 4-hydroxylase
MFDINQIYKIDNFLTDEELATLQKYAQRYVWTFTGFSHDPNSRVFWKKDLMHDLGLCKPVESIFKNKIEQTFNIRVETKDLYMNGQAHGQCGSLHTDVTVDTDGDYLTMVFFPQPQWNPEWGGFTVIIDSAKNIHCIYPNPNSVVIFNSKSPHVGLEPTVHCNFQRISIAYKVKIIKE